jgi:hypothetical protein
MALHPIDPAGSRHPKFYQHGQGFSWQSLLQRAAASSESAPLRQSYQDPPRLKALPVSVFLCLPISEFGSSQSDRPAVVGGLLTSIRGGEIVIAGILLPIVRLQLNNNK